MQFSNQTHQASKTVRSRGTGNKFSHVALEPRHVKRCLSCEPRNSQCLIVLENRRRWTEGYDYPMPPLAVQPTNRTAWIDENAAWR